jgi:formylglycine-generating enzyme required for sulfatase activity
MFVAERIDIMLRATSSGIGSLLIVLAAVSGADLLAQRSSDHARVRDKRPQVFTNRVGMKLKLIPAGEFMMGSPDSEKVRGSDEKQHGVCITQSYYLGVYEVTQGQWEKVMGSRLEDVIDEKSKSKFCGTGADYPMYCVSWYDAVAFCNKLSVLEGKDPYYRITGIKRVAYGPKLGIDSANVSIAGGNGYRLPTEAQWEYACRAGTTTPFHFGLALNGNRANCDGECPYGTEIKEPRVWRTVPVGSYESNAFGLYDMHGNVWEWCADWYAEAYYEKSPANDPAGPASGSFRVNRGGSWDNNPSGCRSANRHNNAPGLRYDTLGFRVALVPLE